ncbi:MAG: integrin alpha [Planctomycetota bacterium]
MTRPILVTMAMLECAAFLPAVRGQGSLLAFEGDRAGDQLGSSVSGLGDIDADGIGDLIVGAWQGGLVGDGGYARVYSGRDGHVLFTFFGDNFDPWGDGDALGYSVAGAGDVNGDGVPDMIVGSPWDDLVGFDTGSAKVFSGKNGSLLYAFSGTPGDISEFGRGIAGPGDLNGDGFADLVVGAPRDDSFQPSAGKVWFFSGANGAVMDGIAGSNAGDTLGWSAAAAGDLNADGFADCVVGAPAFDSLSSSGRVLAYSGKGRAVLLNLTNGLTGDLLGFSVAGVGDANGDGVPDILAGAVDDGSTGVEAGSATLFSGRDGSALSRRFGEQANDHFGWSASGTGDANGDGLPDLIVGMFHTTPPSVTGYAALFSGRTSQRLYRFEGDLTVYDQYGYSVSGAGDINRDGLADVMIGVPNHDPYGSDSGAALVLAGSPLFLDAEPRSANAGQVVTLTAREQPAGTDLLLVVVAVNGSPVFMPLVKGTFDATETWLISGQVPPGLSGITAAFRTYARNGPLGPVIHSSDETILFR